ncbi:MAG: hypothetical protein ACRC68_15565 [Clostridium sp.]
MTKPMFMIKEETTNRIKPTLGRYSDGLRTYEVTFISEDHSRMFGVRCDGSIFEASWGLHIDNGPFIALRVIKPCGNEHNHMFHSGRFAGFVATGMGFRREQKVDSRPVAVGDVIKSHLGQKREVLFVCPADNALVLSDEGRSFIVSPTRQNAADLYVNVEVGVE